MQVVGAIFFIVYGPTICKTIPIEISLVGLVIVLSNLGKFPATSE